MLLKNFAIILFHRANAFCFRLLNHQQIQPSLVHWVKTSAKLTMTSQKTRKEPSKQLVTQRYEPASLPKYKCKKFREMQIER